MKVTSYSDHGGDISLFCALSNIVCGLFDGFPGPDLFDNEKLAKAAAFRRRVGTHRKVASFYALFSMLYLK